LRRRITSKKWGHPRGVGKNGRAEERDKPRFSKVQPGHVQKKRGGVRGGETRPSIGWNGLSGVKKTVTRKHAGEGGKTLHICPKR